MPPLQSRQKSNTFNWHDSARVGTHDSGPPKEALMPKDALTGFLQDEGGAATVDWAVLTGSVVTLAILIVAQIQSAATDVSTGVGAQLSNAEVTTIGTFSFAD